MLISPCSGITYKPARAAVGMLSDPYLNFGKTAAVRQQDCDKYKCLDDINKEGILLLCGAQGIYVGMAP